VLDENRTTANRIIDLQDTIPFHLKLSFNRILSLFIPSMWHLGMKIDQSAISKIEQGHRPVHDYELVALAKALKVSFEWLLEGSQF